MDFEDAPTRRPRRLSWPDHAGVVAAIVVTLVVFRNAVDFDRGAAHLGDCVGFTVAFVVLAYFLCWDPVPRTDGRPNRLAWLQTPAFVTLTLGYLYFAFCAGYVQPGATGLAVIAQVAALTVILGRTG